jgi:hypothetical protein
MAEYQIAARAAAVVDQVELLEALRQEVLQAAAFMAAVVVQGLFVG